MTALTGLVLAGRRGPDDPLARAHGVRHRALLPVAGTPMLVRVLRTLADATRVGRLHVSSDDGEALAAEPEIGARVRAGELALHASLASPSRSAHALLVGPAAGGRALLTTADHALLTPEMVDHFAAAAEATGADVAVAVVPASLLRRHYPDSPRTTLPLRDDAYTGANLFAFLTPEAERAAAFWTRAEAFRKRPWRLVSTFGPGALLAFALRRLDLEAAFARISRAMGVRVAPVRMPFPEAGIDVDREDDLALAARILAQRERSPSSRKLPDPAS